MTTFAYFYWPTISFEELDELSSELKDLSLDKNMKVEEEYSYFFRGMPLRDTSVVGLKTQFKALNRTSGKQIKLSGLCFTIKSRHGIISFNGKISKKKISFEESRKTNAWEKKKKERFVKFWKNDFSYRVQNKKLRLATAIGVIGLLGLVFSYSAELGTMLSYFTIDLLYAYVNSPYSSILVYLELIGPFILAFILILVTRFIEIKADFNSYDRHLEYGRDTFFGFILSHISLFTELSLIPIVFYTYHDSQMIGRITTLSYFLIQQAVDLSAQAILKTIFLSITIGVTLSLIKNVVSSRVYVGRISLRK